MHKKSKASNQSAYIRRLYLHSQILSLYLYHNTCTKFIIFQFGAKKNKDKKKKRLKNFKIPKHKTTCPTTAHKPQGQSILYQFLISTFFRPPLLYQCQKKTSHPMFSPTLTFPSCRCPLGAGECSGDIPPAIGACRI